ncbi:hypothetical protein V202x_48450 [Gimesia aquarii]|uniref:Uncharacterized protein n=1 Tax=Gimesia aquarii TaxID=2527964 RepID=A0A517X1Q0_9PLAN|nr:hypothetical protein V202x_48450 [Gimesia aquarii]
MNNEAKGIKRLMGQDLFLIDLTHYWLLLDTLMKLYQNNTKVAYFIFWITVAVNILLDFSLKKLFNYNLLSGSLTTPKLIHFIITNLLFFSAIMILFFSSFHYKNIRHKKMSIIYGLFIFIIQLACNFGMYVLIMLLYLIDIMHRRL